MSLTEILCTICPFWQLMTLVLIFFWRLQRFSTPVENFDIALFKFKFKYETAKIQYPSYLPPIN